MAASLTWQKSSYSSTGDNCVELAWHPRGVALRESDEPRTVLTASRRRLAALLRASRSGRFDRLG